MKENCFVCGKTTEEICGGCNSRDPQIGVLEFFWNGFLAKKIHVYWCGKCGSSWIEGSDLIRRGICTECRGKALAA
jgi:hypothetical protein